MDEKELSRLNEFWAGRSALTKVEFVAEFLPHPDIGEHCCAEICDFVFQGNDTLNGDQFVSAFNALKTVGWPCGVSADNFAPIAGPKSNESKVTLNEIIAGVTHFEVDQIAWLERRFWERCDRRSLSIADIAFMSSLLSATKRLEVASRVFRLFNEHSGSAIGFKEYVCGLSSLCRGPEAERMKFVVGLWDSDMDGVLSHNDLSELAEFFGFSLQDLLAQADNNAQQHHRDGAVALHLFDFVCLASKSPPVREALLAFSDKVWVALTSTKSPASTPTSTSSRDVVSAAAVGGGGEPEDSRVEDEYGLVADHQNENKHQQCNNNNNNEGDHGQRQQQQRLGGQRRRLGGVRNIGNTCYLGAAIQTLANVSLLSGFLISNEQHFAHLPLVRRYAQMLHSLLVLKETASPVELKECVSTMCTLFADHLQHDSQEFIQFFLDALHESLLTMSTCPSAAVCASAAATFRPAVPPVAVTEQDQEQQQKLEGGDGDGQQQKGALMGVQQMVNNDSGTGADTKDDPAGDGGSAAAVVVAHGDGMLWQNATNHWTKEVLSSGRGSIVLALFAGQFLSMLRCPCCTRSSNTFELFTMLQLQIPTSESILIPFKLVRGGPTTPIVRHDLHVPATTRIVHVKQRICARVGIGVPNNVLVIILNKSDGQYNATFSQMFNNGSSSGGDGAADTDGNDDDRTATTPLLMDIPLSDIDIWCFEAMSTAHDNSVDDDDGGGGVGDGLGHLICVHRQFHFKSSFAVLALNGVGTYTFGTPIVLTFPSKTQKTIRADQLYKMVLDHVQKRYHRHSERHQMANNNTNGGKGGHHLFNRALDANADSSQQNMYPFALALTKTDAIWCHKCEWQRFCRGCPIDANSPCAFALDILLAGQCVLTINWTNISALYLLYNNLAERFMDDFHSQQHSLSSGAELLEDAPGISIDDCLADFTRAEHIDGSRCDRCEKPSTPMPLIKQLSFTRLPEILVICFKRFTFVPSLRQFVKQTVPVSFPLDNFDPSKYFSSDAPAEVLTHFSRYFCIGIVTHYGQLNYGHYCSYVRDFFSDEWFFCNDNKTFPIKSGEVDTRNAYIVFYQRATPSSSSSSSVSSSSSPFDSSPSSAPSSSPSSSSSSVAASAADHPPP